MCVAMHTLLALALPALVAADACGNVPYALGGEQINPPKSTSTKDAATWLADLRSYKKSCRAELAFNGSIYDVAALKWTQTTYMQPQMHLFDRYFYDEVHHNYTVDRWLSDLDRYGGIDSVLLWGMYPNIGADERSQFDILHTIEGHLGIKAGETSADGNFTLTEVECLGACANAPMIQINDYFFEDLTPATTVTLLDDLVAGRPVKIGPQNGRVHALGPQGRTCLKDFEAKPYCRELPAPMDQNPAPPAA